MVPSFVGNLFTHWHRITSYETRYSRLPYGKDPESLSHLGLVYHRVVADGRTDRIPIASGRGEFRGLPPKPSIHVGVMSNDLKLCKPSSIYMLVWTVKSSRNAPQVAYLTSKIEIFFSKGGTAPSPEPSPGDDRRNGLFQLWADDDDDEVLSATQF